MQERLIAAVDLGSCKTSLSVGRVTDGITQVEYYRELPSEGVLKGNIFNPKKACGPLRTLIADAQQALDVTISTVAVALPRWNVKGKSVEFTVQRSNPDEFISEEEVDSNRELAIGQFNSGLDDDLTVYGAVPQCFSTDDVFQVSEDDVIGVTGTTLTGRYMVFSGPKKSKNNIYKVMNELGLAIAKELFVPVLEADCVLTEDEKEHGVALVEIGGGVTSVAVYHGGVIRSYGSFPFGGKTVTNDIHHECGIQDRLAENIKLGFGSCMPDRLQSMAEKIIQIRDSRTAEVQQLPVKYLSEIIGSRMHEIAEGVLHIIGESGYADKLRGGIVLTGGASEILSCGALFSTMSGVASRIGYPHDNRVVCDGCEEICTPGAAAQLSMIAGIRDDKHINCAVQTEQAEPTQGPAQEPKQEPMPEIQPQAAPTKKKKREKKIPFGKMAGYVGNLFDSLGNNENDDN